MRCPVQIVFIPAVLISVALQVFGCTAMGYMSGVHWDTNIQHLTRRHLNSIAAGSTVIVTKYDETIVEGTYNGLFTLPAKDYEQLYATKILDLGSGEYIPSLGERVSVFRVHETGVGLVRDSGSFWGINKYRLLLEAVGSIDALKIPLDSVESIGNHELGLLEGERLRQLVYSESIPVMSYLMVEQGERDLHIPYETVRRIKVEDYSGPWKYVGLTLGLAADLLIISAIWKTIEGGDWSYD